MVKLPETPMMPRLFDERVGYFSTAKVDYSKDEHRAPRRRYITRWRIEKSAMLYWSRFVSSPLPLVVS